MVIREVIMVICIASDVSVEGHKHMVASVVYDCYSLILITLIAPLIAPLMTLLMTHIVMLLCLYNPSIQVTSVIHVYSQVMAFPWSTTKTTPLNSAPRS